MASIQLVDTGGPALLGVYLNNDGAAFPLHYHLYQNNHTPTPASILSDFTESSASGYAEVTVSQSGWTITVSPSGTTIGTNTPVVYTITGVGDFYGYYVTNASGILLWAQRFDSLITFGVLGGAIAITPTFELKSPIP